MSSTSFTEFLHSIVIVFLWSAAIVLSINLVVEGAFSYNLSERTRWHVLLLVFALLASFFVQLPGTDLTRASAAGSTETEDVVKQPSTISTPICNHQDKDLEILALRSANDKLEAAVARERKRTNNAESKTKAAEKKRDDMSYELQTTKENWRHDYLTHVDRLRQLQIANNELVDAEERIRTQVKTVQRSENLAAEWMRKSWAHQEEAIKCRAEVIQCRKELLDINRKMKKVQKEANEKEAATAKVCAKQRAELKRLTAKEQKRASQVIEVSPIKAIIDMAPIRPETKTLVDAVTTIDLSPISAYTTKPSKEEKKATELYQFGSITALLEAARTRTQTMTLIGATTTINIPPIVSEATKSSKEERAAAYVSHMSPVTAIIDIPPTPTSPRSETKTLVGTVVTTSVFPPTSGATEPTEGSTGSAPNPSPILGRKIKKPVSQLNRAGAVAVAAATPVAVSRTSCGEVDLLVEMVEMAKAAQTKAQTKAALYDIIRQLSYVAEISDRDDREFLEFAVDTLTWMSSDGTPSNSILPLFLREMAGQVCQEFKNILDQRNSEGTKKDEDDDEGDVNMGESDENGEGDAEGDEGGEDGNGDEGSENDGGDNVEMTFEEEYEGINDLVFQWPDEDHW